MYCRMDGFAEKSKVIDPFDNRLYTMKFEHSQAHISNCPLNTTCGSESFYCDMLNVDLVTPHDWEVAFVFGDYRRIVVCLHYV